MSLLRFPLLFAAVLVAFSVPSLGAANEITVPTLIVGHVGHDHQIALYAAADAGQSLEKVSGVYLKELKPQEVYDLYDKGRLVARLNLVRVGGGSKMPAALEQGHIEVGLGGLGPVVKFIDKGSPLKVLAPLNNDGDALLLRSEFKAGSWADFVKLVKTSSRPLKIGFKDPMANAYLIFSRALSEEGIAAGQEPVGADGKPVQVVLMNLQGDENTLPSMESGIIDGVVANEPMPSILAAKKVGYRVVDLSGLPPAGKWKDHPCCVVAAGEKVIREKRGAVKSLLKAIAAGSDIVLHDKAKALAAETRWTRTAPEIGEKSIANVTYVARPDQTWIRAVDIWLELMQSSKAFQKGLQGKSPLDIRTIAFDLKPLEEALAELPAAGK